MNKLEGIFTTRSPLSHIGESISNASYLVQEPIIQPDNSVAEVFCYSGNAWRGQLRDMAAHYMLNRYAIQVPVDAFHLLFSGGKIGGDQKVNIGKIKALREAIPMIGLFGGGIGNALLPGQMRVGNCYPLCAEAMPALPESLHDRCGKSYAVMTFEKEFSRKDDSKDARIPFLDEPPPTEKGEKKQADQMRMAVELLVTGAELRTYIHLLDDSEIYLGVLLSALSVFAESPFIGGQANKGHGLVELFYQLNGKDFAQINDEGIRLSKDANRILEDYNAKLDEIKELAVEALQ